MKNDNIAKKLKFYRKQNNLSVHDVACQLSIDQNVVADKTIYGWESGQAQPDADIRSNYAKFTILIIFLRLSVTMKVCPSMSSPHVFEMKLLKSYREHPELHPAIHKLLGLDESNPQKKS